MGDTDCLFDFLRKCKTELVLNITLLLILEAFEKLLGFLMNFSFSIFTNEPISRFLRGLLALFLWVNFDLEGKSLEIFSKDFNFVFFYLFVLVFPSFELIALLSANVNLHAGQMQLFLFF